jgi:hypothetical protein
VSVPNLIADGVTEEMRVATNRKFSLWDSVIEKRLLDGSPKERLYALGLLQDPTIYAYAFFKNNKGEPLKLYPYQDIILNDRCNRIQVVAANQTGKSLCLCVGALHYALMNPGTTCLMTSKTLPQSKDLLRTIKRLLRSSPLDNQMSIGDTDTKTEIYFKHYEEVVVDGKREARELEASRIICVPATEAALGYPANRVFVDELAFYEDGHYFFFQIVQPRTYTTKGQIIAYSNPNGQQGCYWELWNDQYFHHYRFTFLDCPTNSQEEYDRLKEMLSQDEFDSTVDATFTSARGGFLSLEERREMQLKNRYNVLPPIQYQPIFIFYDWGKANDRTVRTIGYPVGPDDELGIEVVEMKEYPDRTPYSEIVDDLIALIGVVGFENVAMVGWDNTGVGKGIEDFIVRIEELGVSAQPVEFSLENKSRMYTMFKVLVERNLRGKHGIKIPFVQKCDEQLSKLLFNRTSRGYLQVHHERESDRDDFPDSLAGLVSLIISPENPPVTATIVTHDIQGPFDRSPLDEVGEWDDV